MPHSALKSHLDMPARGNLTIHLLSRHKSACGFTVAAVNLGWQTASSSTPKMSKNQGLWPSLLDLRERLAWSSSSSVNSENIYALYYSYTFLCQSNLKCGLSKAGIFHCSSYKLPLLRAGINCNLFKISWRSWRENA